MMHHTTATRDIYMIYHTKATTRDVYTCGFFFVAGGSMFVDILLVCGMFILSVILSLCYFSK